MLDSRAYTEAFCIINLMSEEMRNKIPKKILDNIQKCMDEDYEFYIDEDEIENVELLEDTEKILSVLYTDYLSTDEERKIILNKEKVIANSKIKKNTIKTQKMFQDKNIANDINTEIEKNKSLINIEKLYSKILSFIKKIFRNWKKEKE